MATLSVGRLPVSMSGSARSTKGCWTCRLRKKKCDEGKPVCLTCNNLAVTCHRYGPKPEWMDGKHREKDMAEIIRRAVKEKTAEKKRIAMKRQQQRQQSNGSTNNAAAKEPTHPAPPATTLPSAAQTDWSDGWGGRAMNRVSRLIATDPPLSDFSVVPEQIDAELLMHYLDNVFPLQFPFYKPSVVAGGRGWLLSILTTTKPLYHAAISLAAYHRQSILCRDSASKDHGLDLESLERQYARALSELWQYLAKIGDKNKARTQVENIDVLSCLAMLISLEVGISSLKPSINSDIVARRCSKEMQEIGGCTYLQRRCLSQTSNVRKGLPSVSVYPQNTNQLYSSSPVWLDGTTFSLVAPQVHRPSRNANVLTRLWVMFSLTK